MSLRLDPNDLVRLLRDEHPSVRRAAERELELSLGRSEPGELCTTLWDLAGTDAHEALPWVVPALAHPDERIGRFALLALRGLHPLLALRARPGAPPAELSATGMRDWQEPRSRFEAALRALLRREAESAQRIVTRLAELPGEHERIARVVAEESAPETLDRYRSLHAQAASRRAPVQLILALTYRCNRKCPYCYAYESQDAYDADLEMSDARACLDWAVRRGAELISFTGGEPTHHPRFPELAAEVGSRGLRLYLNTNGLFEEPALEALKSSFIKNVGFHVSERKLHRRGEIETITRNARALVAAGVEVFFRHTLWRHGYDDVEWLLRLSAELGIRHLNLALAFPGRTATNRHLRAVAAEADESVRPGELLHDVKPVYLKALELAATLGIRVRASKPVPLCLFTRAEFARLQRHHELVSVCSVHERDGVHNLVVNPDLSVYPCVGLPFAGARLTSEESYAPHAEHCQREIRRALRIVQSACDGCALGGLGVCQASCLGHCNERQAAEPAASATP